MVDFDYPQVWLVEIDGNPPRCQQGCYHLRDVYFAGCGIGRPRVAHHAVRDDLPAVIHLIQDALRRALTPDPFPYGKGNRKISTGVLSPLPPSQFWEGGTEAEIEPLRPQTGC